MYKPKPHISQAVQHARGVVSFAALVLGVCLFMQVVVWAAIHYTDVRAPSGRSTTPDHPTFNVIQNSGASMFSPGDLQGMESRAADGSMTALEAEMLLRDILGGQDPGAAGPAAQADMNETQSAGAIMLRRFSHLVQTMGLVAALVFAISMFQAMVIAGGAGIPGIEKAVSASSWAMVVAILCLPLGSIFPTTPYQGVFQSYTHLVEASQAYRGNAPGAPGALGFYGANVLMPFAILATLLVVILRFRAGVEAGVIVTSVSQLDEKLEQEIRGMKLGQLASPRAVGALNSALGDGETSGKRMRIGKGNNPSLGTGTDGGKRRPI